MTMKKHWTLLILSVTLVLAPAGLALAYGNHDARDWRTGGPHRTINELASDTYIEAAADDPLLSRYDFRNAALKVQGETIGEPGLFRPGKEERSEPFRWWVMEGGYSADEPELYASFRHFYDPLKAAQGQPAHLTDHLDEIGDDLRTMGRILDEVGLEGSEELIDALAANPQVDARGWAIDGDAGEGWGDNAYCWNEGLEAMRRAFESVDGPEKSREFAHAWRALGETMHLLADMTLPAHVRNDSHPGLPINWSLVTGNRNPGLGKMRADAYESYASGGVILDAGKHALVPTAQAAIESSADPLALFHAVALFTNENFFSSDTVSGVMDYRGIPFPVSSANGMPDYPAPKLQADQYDPETGEYVTRLDGRPVCLAHESWLAAAGWGEADPMVNFDCAVSQAGVLIPVAMAGNARLLEWYVPRLELEITEVDTDNDTVKGVLTHHTEDSAYDAPLTFNTTDGTFSALRLNGMTQNPDDFIFTIADNVLTVTYNDDVAGNMESLSRGGGNVAVSVVVDVGGIAVSSNEFSLGPLTPTPTGTSSATLTPTPTGTGEAGEGEWVLQEIIQWQEVFADDACYPGHAFTLGDGAYSSSESWTEACSGLSDPGAGSFTVNCSWSPPPSYLKVGTEVNLRASCDGSATHNGKEGDRNASGSVTLWYTEHPPDNCPTCRTYGTTDIVFAQSTGWASSGMSSDSQEGTMTVPGGQPGDVLVIVARAHEPGGRGEIAHKYVYGGTEPVPEREVEPELEPVAPDTPVLTATPKPTGQPTVTATPTLTPTEEEPPDDGAAGNGPNDEVTLKVVNGSNVNIWHLYVAPISSESWGDERLGAGTLSVSENIRLPLAPGVYALASLDEQGEEIEIVRGLIVEDDMTWTVTRAEARPDGVQAQYGKPVFSSDYDYDTLRPIDPGEVFAAVNTLYAHWAYAGVAAGTEYVYEWYRDSELLETNRNVLWHDEATTFDMYARDPGAQQPLLPGTYAYRVLIDGRPVSYGTCEVR